MGKDMGNKKKSKSSRGLRGFLHLLQHLLIAVAVVAVLIVTTGSTVVITGLNGNESYSLHASDQEKRYEESELFNTIYGRAVADIIRFGVVRSQLETDAEFDGKKVIDVTAYNYRDIGLPEQYVTARYYLEDLLKWSKYGLEYSESYMTMEQAEEFLGDKTMLTIVDPNSKYYNTSDANYLKSDIGSYTFVDDVSSNMMYTDGDVTEEGYRAILVNRYKTVEGMNLEEYTADWTSYQMLCDNLFMAMDSLSYNYEEYLSYHDYYAADNTNIRYYIEKTVGDHTEYFTNMEDFDFVAMSDEIQDKNMAEFFREQFNGKYDDDTDKYLYYSPSEMIYESNSDIEESTVRNIVQEYDYAFPEDIKIWIAVDTDYPVNDAFTQGLAGFRNYLPYFWQWIALAIAAVVLYLAIVLFLVINTGKEIDEAGKNYTRLSGFDKLPTEIAIIIGGIAACIVCGLSIVLVELYDDILTYEDIYTVRFKAAIGIGVFVIDYVFFFFFYSLVRRIKAKTLWKNSYLKRLVRKISVFTLEVYDNGNIVIRTWVPYIIFLLFNLLMIITGIGIVVAIIVDVLIGIFLYRDVKDRQNIVKGIEKITEGNFSYQIDQNNLHGDNLVLAKSVNSIGNGIKNAVENSMKDERMKADLITNVSHDIKTPLTSIINYVDLIKREEVDNVRVRNYIQVLDEKSQRLKQLTDDLVEASKISSGNIVLQFEKINLTELMNQTIGEFSEKFEQKNLTTVMNVNASNVIIEADSRRIWRVMENLFNNIYKYALEGTRVYVAIGCVQIEGETQERVEISIKNISAMELNCNPQELTERFIRGDESRTTEGSGLGLSIAKNLTEVQNGTFEILLDGDLFKVVMTFPILQTK